MAKRHDLVIAAREQKLIQDIESVKTQLAWMNRYMLELDIAVQIGFGLPTTHANNRASYETVKKGRSALERWWRHAWDKVCFGDVREKDACRKRLRAIRKTYGSVELYQQYAVGTFHMNRDLRRLRETNKFVKEFYADQRAGIEVEDTRH